MKQLEMNGTPGGSARQVHHKYTTKASGEVIDLIPAWVIENPVVYF